MDIAPDTPTAQAFHYACTACQVNVATREAMLHHAHHVHSPHSLTELIGEGVIAQVEHIICLGCHKVFLDKQGSHRHRSHCQGLAIEPIEKDHNQNVAQARSSPKRIKLSEDSDSVIKPDPGSQAAKSCLEKADSLAYMQSVFGEGVCNELTKNSKGCILDILMRLKNNADKLLVFECFPEKIPWNYWLVIKRVEDQAGRLIAKDPTGQWHYTSGQKSYFSWHKSTGYVKVYAQPSESQKRRAYPTRLFSSKTAQPKEKLSDEAFRNSFCYTTCLYRRVFPSGTAQRKRVYCFYYPDGSKGEHIYVIFESNYISPFSNAIKASRQ